jgi:hypothetical protein
MDLGVSKLSYGHYSTAQNLSSWVAVNHALEKPSNWNDFCAGVVHMI